MLFPSALPIFALLSSAHSKLKMIATFIFSVSFSQNIFFSLFCYQIPIKPVSPCSKIWRLLHSQVQGLKPLPNSQQLQIEASWQGSNCQITLCSKVEQLTGTAGTCSAGGDIGAGAGARQEVWRCLQPQSWTKQ